jgi:hypothetical protein
MRDHSEPTRVEEFSMITHERSQVRNNFNDQIKLKAQQLKEEKDRLDEEAKERDYLDVQEMRKKMIPKTRGMPTIKPFQVQKSNQSLTVPITPFVTKHK